MGQNSQRDQRARRTAHVRRPPLPRLRRGSPKRASREGGRTEVVKGRAALSKRNMATANAMREIPPSTPVDGRRPKAASPAPVASHTNAGVQSTTATDAHTVNDQRGIPT